MLRWYQVESNLLILLHLDYFPNCFINKKKMIFLSIYFLYELRNCYLASTDAFDTLPEAPLSFSRCSFNCKI